MKFKYFILIISALLIFTLDNANASSINYNLYIDKDMRFHENIIYNIDKSNIQTDDYYDFLDSVVKDDIYFDLNEEIKYNKSKVSSDTGYVVTLKYDYSSIFLAKSRILNECFVSKNFNTDIDSIQIRISDFYCSHRADKITIRISTPLTVTSNNANSVNGNSYIWNATDNSFSIDFNVKKSPIEEKPMDDPVENEQENSSDDNTTIDNNDSNQNQDENNIGNYIVIVLGIIALISLPIIAIILKKKKDALDEI